MTTIQRSALVRQPAERMFDLVNDVGGYPARFRWCEASEVIEVSDAHMLARLALRMGGLRTSFTTRNTLQRPERIELALVDGPFRKLSGAWTFQPLDATACRVGLLLDFEVAGKLMGSALAMGFQGLADRLVDEFCREAQRHG